MRNRSPNEGDVQGAKNWIVQTTKSKAEQLGFPLEHVTWGEDGVESEYELWLHWTGRKTKALVSRKVMDGLKAGNAERQRRDTENWISQVLRSLMRYSRSVRAGRN